MGASFELGRYIFSIPPMDILPRVVDVFLGRHIIKKDMVVNIIGVVAAENMNASFSLKTQCV